MNTSPEFASALRPTKASPPTDELLLNSILHQADMQFARQEWLAARVSLELAVSLAPNRPELHGSLGSLQYQLKEYSAACATFNAAINLRPEDSDLQIQLAMVHVQLGQMAEAKAALERSLKLNPRNFRAREMLGNLDFAGQRWAEAAEHYCFALEGYPDGVSLLLHLGKCQYELHDIGSARWCFERVLSLDSANVIAAEALEVLSARGGPKPTADEAEPKNGVSDSASKRESFGCTSASEGKGSGCVLTANIVPMAAAGSGQGGQNAPLGLSLNSPLTGEAQAESQAAISIMVEPQYREEHNELLSHAYAEARRPYLETVSPIPAHAFKLPSWRYFVEINSGCNLRCTMCIRGDSKGYGHKNGFMDQQLFEQILDKIKDENSGADICLYGNSEPFLHPRLHECVTAVKERGLTCLVSTNLNSVKNLRQTLEAKPDTFIISLSGFSQEVYARAHVGGDIELVKANMQLVARTRASLGSTVPVLVHYHLYQDNWGDEFDNMKAFATKLGFAITVSWARSISMEKTIQYLRYKEKQTRGVAPPLKVSPAGYGANESLVSLFPEVTETFLQDIERLGIKPDEATELYKNFPEPIVCPVGDMFTYIRYDGSVSLCSCVSDTRLTVASNFLRVSQEQLHRRRRFNPLCRECLRYKMHMYYHIVDIPMWDRTMAQKFPTIPVDRRKF